MRQGRKGRGRGQTRDGSDGARKGRVRTKEKVLLSERDLAMMVSMRMMVVEEVEEDEDEDEDEELVEGGGRMDKSMTTGNVRVERMVE